MFSYRGDETEFIEGFWMEKNESCEVCSEKERALCFSVSSSCSLQCILNELKEKMDLADSKSFVSLWAGSKLLYAEVISLYV